MTFYWERRGELFFIARKAAFHTVFRASTPRGGPQRRTQCAHTRVKFYFPRIGKFGLHLDARLLGELTHGVSVANPSFRITRFAEGPPEDSRRLRRIEWIRRVLPKRLTLRNPTPHGERYRCASIVTRCLCFVRFMLALRELDQGRPIIDVQNGCRINSRANA